MDENEILDELSDRDDSSTINITIPIEMIQSFKDIVVDEQSSVTFKCVLKSEKNINVTWYKEGIVVKRDRSENVESNTEQTFELVIPSVTLKDYKMIYFYSNYWSYGVQSIARLYVRPMPLFDNNRGYIYVDDCLDNKGIIRRHLTNVIVNTGEEINFILHLENTSDFSNTFEWYKSNEKIVQGNHITITNDALITKLTILEAEISDTGIYQVVIKTKGGIVSSIAHAIVVDVLYDTHHNTIEDEFPHSVEAYINEEVNLVCKAITQPNTVMQCKKNDIVITEDHPFYKNIKCLDYGNGYFGLKIIKEELAEIFEYTLEFTHPDGNVDATSTFVDYRTPPCDIQPVTVLQPLQSVVAYLGARILFKCGFDIKNNDKTLVIWRVGRFTVERTDHRFHVICYCGEFYLVIKRLEPDMIGLVTCELRHFVVKHRSVLISSTTADLVAVPPAFFHTDLYLQAIMNKHVFYSTLSTDLDFCLLHDQIDGIDKSDLINHEDEANNECICNETVKYNSNLMTIDCCRLQDDIFCNLNTAEEFSEVCRRTLKLVVEIPEKIQPTETVHYSPKNALLKWDSHKMRIWYSIEKFQPDGSYQEIRQSSAPVIDLRDLIMERVLKLRVKAIVPLPKDVELSAIIRQGLEVAETEPKIGGMRTLRSYYKKYKDGNYIIGSGAFGLVTLVEDSDRNLYAAKTIDVGNKSKMSAAMNEYNILKRSHHPTIVQLYGGFADSQKAIFVFKFYWAGTLFDRLISEKQISEDHVAVYVRQICSALQYLHSISIIHMDIKPENIICTHQNSLDVKLIDFGLAHVLEDNVAVIKYGTKLYLPPEAIKREHVTPKSDMWSVGVVTYYLLSCALPFLRSGISNKIVDANFHYNYIVFDTISDMAKDFINHLLVVRPSKRMSAKRAQAHQWLNESNTSVYNKYTGRRTLQELKKYVDKNKLDQQPGTSILKRRWSCKCKYNPCIKHRKTSCQSNNTQ